MTARMQTIQEDIDAIVPYSMHVSSRYLDLTKQKLELTRLPKENSLLSPRAQWGLGVPKSVLEPLLDHWLESYDWRAQEDMFNASLPQFRTLISRPSPPQNGTTTTSVESTAIRTHFVHVRSSSPGAVPLLYIHSWPGSFIEAGRLIPLLTSPESSVQTAGAVRRQAFHVVAPSIPGFGFSDCAVEPEFGVKDAAEVFAALMRRLGYEEFVVCGEGWGFQVARAMAMAEPEGARVKGVFTWNPVFERPVLGRGVMGWVKWQVARATGAKWPALSFGYVPSEVLGTGTKGGEKRKGGDVLSTRLMGPVLHQLLSVRPQTMAFSLCDSPVGLLAVLLDLLGVQGAGPSLGARPRSPFLDPEELEQQDREYEAAGHERVRSDDTVKASQNAVGPEGTQVNPQPWSPTDILNWTMMMWLPGAEAGLRWLRRAHIETSMPAWNAYCNVPLGISSYRSSASTPLMWGASAWPIAWIRRHHEAIEMPAWEAPRLLANDLGECFARLLDSQGKRVAPEAMV